MWSIRLTPFMAFPTGSGGTRRRLLDVYKRQEWGEGDRLFLESIKADAIQDPIIQEAAKVNTLENFSYKAKRLVDDLVMSRIDKNNHMVAKCFDNPEFQHLVQQALYRSIYYDIHAQ